MRPVPTDLVEYQRRRRISRLASLVAALVLGYLALATMTALLQSGGPDPLGLIAFILLAIAAATSWFVLRRLWRRSFDARAVTLSADPTPGEVYGMPELDEPPRAHLGLSGEATPPTRW